MLMAKGTTCNHTVPDGLAMPLFAEYLLLATLVVIQTRHFALSVGLERQSGEVEYFLGEDKR